MRHPRVLALSASLVVLPASIAWPEIAKAEPIDISIFCLRAYAPRLTLPLIDLPPRGEDIAAAKVETNCVLK